MDDWAIYSFNISIRVNVFQLTCCALTVKTGCIVKLSQIFLLCSVKSFLFVFLNLFLMHIYLLECII